MGNGPCVCDEVADNDAAGARANDLDYRRGIGMRRRLVFARHGGITVWEALSHDRPV